MLYATEKYDMPGLASIVRSLLRAASTRSLTVNLYEPKYRPALLRLPTADILGIFELHHERRDQFRQRIAEPSFLTDAEFCDAPRCSRCRDSVSYVEWRELRNASLPSSRSALLGAAR